MTIAQGYRQEIDGLRALAVIPVILFHAGVPGFAGGYIGVDVFFVISGYLISGILLREIASGTYSVAAFYERRARRILPALVVVALASSSFAIAWMLPWQLEEFGRSLLSTLFFGSNFYFVGTSDYFSPASEEMPLLHTWSLAVEEQYYLVFPLLFALLLRRGLKTTISVIGALALVSLALTEIGWRRWPDENFYLLPTRAWELLAGVLVATWQYGRAPIEGRVAQILAAFGLIAILVSVVMLGRETPFPSAFALPPVAGTALVLAFGSGATFVGRLLSTRVLVQIGLMSYSLYLWHQPLFAFARIRSIEAVPVWKMMLLSIAAGTLAWMTWKFIEIPARQRGRFGTGRFAGSAVVLNAVIIAVGISFIMGAGFPSRWSPEVNAMAELGRPAHAAGKDCIPLAVPDAVLCQYLAAGPSKVAIWGDSHAMAIAPSLANELRVSGISLIDATRAGCMPIRNVYATGREHCLKWNERVLAWLEGSDSPGTIVISARWAPALHGETFDNGEGGREPEEVIEYRHLNGEMVSPLNSQNLAGELAGELDRLRRAGKDVVLIAGVPEMGWNVPTTIAKSLMHGQGPSRPLSISLDVFKQRNTPVVTLLSRLARETEVELVDPSGIFCDSYLVDRCVAEDGQSVFYRDDDHLSPAGADLLARKIVQEALLKSSFTRL